MNARSIPEQIATQAVGDGDRVGVVTVGAGHYEVQITDIDNRSTLTLATFSHASAAAMYVSQLNAILLTWDVEIVKAAMA